MHKTVYGVMYTATTGYNQKNSKLNRPPQRERLIRHISPMWNSVGSNPLVRFTFSIKRLIFDLRSSIRVEW